MFHWPRKGPSPQRHRAHWPASNHWSAIQTAQFSSLADWSHPRWGCVHLKNTKPRRARIGFHIDAGWGLGKLSRGKCSGDPASHGGIADREWRIGDPARGVVDASEVIIRHPSAPARINFERRIESICRRACAVRAHLKH